MIHEYPYHVLDEEQLVNTASNLFSRGKYGLHRDNRCVGLISWDLRHIMIVKYRRKGFLIRGPRIRWLASVNSIVPGDAPDLGSAVSDNIIDAIRLARDIVDRTLIAPYSTFSLAKEAVKAMG